MANGLPLPGGGKCALRSGSAWRSWARRVLHGYMAEFATAVEYPLPGFKDGVVKNTNLGTDQVGANGVSGNPDMGFELHP